MLSKEEDIVVILSSLLGLMHLIQCAGINTSTASYQQTVKLTALVPQMTEVAKLTVAKIGDLVTTLEALPDNLLHKLCGGDVKSTFYRYLIICLSF